MTAIQRQSELTRLENVIQSSATSAGAALKAILDHELYKVSFDTFEEYCQIRWNFSKHTGYRMIKAAETAESLPPHLSHMCDKLRVAGELSKVPEEHRLRVAETVMANGHATIKGVQDAAAAASVLELSACQAQFQRITDLHRALSGEAVSDWAMHAMNVMREMGMHLQGAAGRKHLDRTHFLHWIGQLPETLTFDQAKECVRIANKFREPITAVQQLSGETDAILRVAAGVVGRSRTAAQNFKTTPITECLHAVQSMEGKIEREKPTMGAEEWQMLADRLRDHANWLVGIVGCGEDDN